MIEFPQEFFLLIRGDDRLTPKKGWGTKYPKKMSAYTTEEHVKAAVRGQKSDQTYKVWCISNYGDISDVTHWFNGRT